MAPVTAVRAIPEAKPKHVAAAAARTTGAARPGIRAATTARATTTAATATTAVTTSASGRWDEGAR